MPVLFLAPAVLTLLAVSIFPLIYSLLLTFNSWNLASQSGWKWVGLQNFELILTADPFFKSSLLTTAIYVFGSVTVQFLLGLGIALLVSRPFKGQSLVRTLILLPMMTTPVVVGIVWRYMYNPELGLVNYLFSLLRLPQRVWLGETTTALPAVMVAEIWAWTPFVALVLMSALHALPKEPYEAVAIDGGAPWQAFWYVTLPLLRPTILVVLLIRLMDAFKAFDVLFVTTRGGPGISTEVLSLYTYRNGFKFFQMGYAAALSYVMLILITLVSQFLVRSMTDSGRERTQTKGA
jgi:multiple sugar transport system permease protein